MLYSEAKSILSKFADKGGYCPNGKPVDLFVREVLQFMLFQGNYGNERKFCFHAQKGCFTVPYDLETPLKVKVDNIVGSVWNRWYEFSSTSILDDCIPAQDALFEDPNTYPTVYDMPASGGRVAVVATTQEKDDAFVIVQGVDNTGREIVTFDNGVQISGEKLKICWGQLRYSQAHFGEVKNIVKSPTNGYVQLVWHDPVRFLKGFLSDYSPLEEHPEYRRFKLTARCNCTGDVARVSVIGRIRLKEKYTDNDKIPFDNIYAMSLAGQTIFANYREKTEVAMAKTKMLTNVVNQENSYKKVNNGTPLEFYRPTSGGSIRGVNR